MAWKSKNNIANYWKNLTITQSDLNALTNHLFETEVPEQIDELSQVLINNRLQEIKAEEELKQEEAGFIYHPKEDYPIGTKLIFPEHDWTSGLVTDKRQGQHPMHGSFTVITVNFENGTTK